MGNISRRTRVVAPLEANTLSIGNLSVGRQGIDIVAPPHPRSFVFATLGLLGIAS